MAADVVRHDGEEIDEHTFLMAIVRGVAFGVPSTFLITMAMIWIADSHIANWGAALWVALVAGGFLGTVVTLNHALDQLHRKGHAH